MTFDLSSPVPKQDSTATAAAAAVAAAAADDTPDAQPPDCSDGADAEAPDYADDGYAEAPDFADDWYAEAPDYANDGYWYPDEDTPGEGARGGPESALAAERAHNPAGGLDSEGDALEPRALVGKTLCDDVSILPSAPGDVGTATSAATTPATDADEKDGEDNETRVQPRSPPLSPFVKPRSVSTGCNAEFEGDEDSPSFRMPASQRHAVLHPARSITTTAASVGAFVPSPPAPLSPPSTSPPTLCLSGSPSTPSSPPVPGAGNASSMGSGLQRARKPSRRTDISLTQEAPSRKHRREAESVRATAAARGRSQPIGGRPAMSVSLAPLEDTLEPRSPAGLRGGGGGAVPQLEVMPSFDRMTVQELAGMVSVYGLKKSSKRWVVVVV